MNIKLTPFVVGAIFAGFVATEQDAQADRRKNSLPGDEIGRASCRERVYGTV